MRSVVWKGSVRLVDHRRLRVSKMRRRLLVHLLEPLDLRQELLHRHPLLSQSLRQWACKFCSATFASRCELSNGHVENPLNPLAFSKPIILFSARSKWPLSAASASTTTRWCASRSSNQTERSKELSTFWSAWETRSCSCSSYLNLFNVLLSPR